jgi:twitching motility protein PilT
MLDLNPILQKAEALQAATVHLRAGRPPVLRVHQRLVPLEMPPVNGPELDATVRRVLTREQIADYETRGDVSFLYRDGDVCYKASLLRTVDGEGLVLKRIGRTHPTIEELGLPPNLADYLSMRTGLVLLTGPIGCGKTTTLTALLHRINRDRSLHVLSIEDPIEYVLDDGASLVQQCEVGQHVTTMREGVELARLTSPDLLVVSELADRDTVDAVLRAAQGTLVVGAVHAASVAQALAKLERAFPAEERGGFRRRLSDVLRVCACQVLAHRQYGTGVLPVFEILVATGEVQDILREGAWSRLRGVMERGRGLGMCSLDDALYEMVVRNEVLVDEATLYAVDKERFEACRRLPHMA